MNETGVIHSTLIKPIAKFLVEKIKSQFWLNDDPDSYYWNNFEMNGEKVRIYDDKLVFRNSGKNSTLRGDFLKMLTDYKFVKTASPDAKIFIDIMDGRHFDIQAWGKSLRDKTHMNIDFNKRAILASVLKTIFLSDNPNELCDKLKLLLQEKRAGNISNIINKKIGARFDKLLQYKCIAPTQYKKII